MKPPIWVNRKFTYRPARALFPNLVTRLAGTPARLEEILRSIPVSRLTAKPGGMWSALENAGHLGDLEELWFRRFQDFRNGKTMLSAWDVTNRKTEMTGHNNRLPNDITATFRSERERLVALLYNLDLETLTRVSLHPRLKTPMSATELAFFIAEHDDHHLAMVRWLGEGDGTE